MVFLWKYVVFLQFLFTQIMPEYPQAADCGTSKTVPRVVKLTPGSTTIVNEAIPLALTGDQLAKLMSPMSQHLGLSKGCPVDSYV